MAAPDAEDTQKLALQTPARLPQGDNEAKHQAHDSEEGKTLFLS